jgi:hypothetical protein
LPAGALFCGECGRAVTPAAKRVPRMQVPTVVPSTRREQPVMSGSEPSDFRPSGPSDNWHWGDSIAQVCETCGATLSSDEIFCGECGAVSKAAALGFGRPQSPSQPEAWARDTAIIQPVELDDLPPMPAGQREILPEPNPLGRSSVYAPITNEPGTNEPVVHPPVFHQPDLHQQFSREPLRYQSAPPRVAPATAPVDNLDDLEKTRITAPDRHGETYVLQFSTGERSTVYGTGLIGRNPRPEPGEYFDQIVPVIDPSRSVSKTHLEFGQESGAFWVMDRYSGNGTVLREPNAQAIRCQPERRYRIARGTRVEIGDQFFIVS